MKQHPPKVCNSVKSAFTTYFNIFWYFTLSLWLLAKYWLKDYEERFKCIFCGACMHVLSFCVASHYLIYYTDFHKLCNKKFKRNLKRGLIDFAVHGLMLVITLILLPTIKDGFDISSNYFLSGVFGFCIWMIAYGFAINMDDNIYGVSFKDLGFVYIVCLIISFSFLLFYEFSSSTVSFV
jgi:hypothetical protein